MDLPALGRAQAPQERPVRHPVGDEGAHAVGAVTKGMHDGHNVAD